MAEASTFSARDPLLLVGAGIVASIAVIVASLLPQQEDTYHDRYGPRMLSRTVLGYAGLAEELRRRGHVVVRERFLAREDAEPGAADTVRIIAEPVVGVSDIRRTHLIQRFNEGAAIVVLPKRWPGAVDARGWLRNVAAVSSADVRSTLHVLDPNATLAAGSAALEWMGTGIRLPKTTRSWQLVQSKLFTPVLAGPDGMLLGSRSFGLWTSWLVSDPDLLNNLDFADPALAAVRQRLLASLADGATVLFDETRAEAPKSTATFLSEFFQVPMVYVLVYALLVLLLSLWAATPRFGPVRPSRQPGRGAGKGSLIRTAAGLLRLAGQDSEIVRRYFGATLRDAARRFHAPGSMDEDEMVDWLDRIGAWRNLTREGELAALRDRVARRSPTGRHSNLMADALRINTWKRRLLHGPRDNPDTV